MDDTFIGLANDWIKKGEEFEKARIELKKSESTLVKFMIKNDLESVSLKDADSRSVLLRGFEPVVYYGFKG